MLSERLKLAMKEAGVSQADLARACGVKPPSVNGWLSGKSKFLRGENLLAAARALNVSEEWLATGQGPMKPRTGLVLKSFQRKPEAAQLELEEAELEQVTSPQLDRLSEVLRESGVDNLVHKLGMSAGDLDREVSGGTIPVEVAVRIQEASGFSSVWLLLGKGPKKVAIRYDDDWNPIPIPPTSIRKIPVLAMAQLGDNGHFCDMEYPVGHGDGYLQFFSSDPDAYGLRCVGDSMEPRIKDGEFVVAAPNHRVTNGDEVLVKSKDGRVMIKILGFARDGYTSFLSVNQKHGIVKIPNDDIEKLDFIEAIVKASAWVPD